MSVQRKKRADAGKPRKPAAQKSVLIQVRLSPDDEMRPREADAYRVWTHFLRAAGNRSRPALVEALIAAGQQIDSSFIPAPADARITSDMLRLLRDLQGVVEALRRLDFNSAQVIDDVRQVAQAAHMIDVDDLVGSGLLYDDE